MASSALRAASSMRILFFSRSQSITSRTISCKSLSHGNTIGNSNLIKYHYSPIQQQQLRYNTTTQIAAEHEDNIGPKSSTNLDSKTRRSTNTKTLDKIVLMFEERCQKNERVVERDFVRTFNLFTKVVDELTRAGGDNPEIFSNISLYSTLLLRCCGKLMFDTPPKGRELLAGNLWTFLKEKNIPLDISHYNCLLRVLNENNTVFDPEKILEEIKERKLDPDRVTYQRLIHQYCQQGDITGATKLLETMKDLNMELNEATFASLITGYCKQDKPPASSEMFDLMRSNGVEPGSKSYLAALTAQADRFSKNPEKASEEFTKILDCMAKDDIAFSVNEQIDLIEHLGPLKQSHEVVSSFLDKYINSLYGTVGTRYKILSALIRANQFETASNIFWSQKVHEKAIQSGNVGAYYIRALSKHFNTPADFVMKECSKLVEKEWNPKGFYLLYFSAAESGRVDLVRDSMRKFCETDPMKIHYTWPLIAQAKDTEEIIKVLEEDLNPRMDSNDLLETFSQWVWPRFADDVKKLFEANKRLKYDNNILMASFLNFSVQEGKIEEAIKFISEVPQDLVEETKPQATEEDNEAEPESTPRLSRPTERSNLVARLLNQIAEQTKDPELVKKAFNMCQVPSQQLSAQSLAALVRVHLLKEDFNSALEEFLNIAREHRVTPCRTELMSHCLLKKDPESLQKIMNAVSGIFGEPNSLFDLAVCCLKSKKLKQAQKIFASPGFRVRPIRVYQTCRGLARNGSIETLENFVNLTRDMYDINQEYLYQVLIDTYDRTSNAKRALNLWNLMQEEEFQPSKKSLVMIANLLEKNGIQVPFQKPRVNYSEKTETKT